MTRAGSRLMTSRASSKSPGRTIALASPVSSSSVMKQMPFAVPGRCRVITAPPIFTRVPGAAWASFAAGHSSGSCARSNFIGCTPVVSDRCA